jgi:thymidylate synthase ThyX
MSEIEKYVDKAMYPAAPMAQKEPTAHLLWMTPDPLGAVAAACRMYKGIPTYSLADITDEERRDYWYQVQQTELQAPLEFIKLHVFFEGVDRALTHQAVRQRTAVYAQESLRFAVKDGQLLEETSRPPSLDDPTRSQSIRNDLEDIWNETICQIESGYRSLIANGMPAEDARGLLPTAILTRYNYATDLRNLAAEAGKRLCTQAQFHWRQAFMSLREAIRNYEAHYVAKKIPWNEPDATPLLDVSTYGDYRWQFELIADSNLFAPVCYQIGKCGFKAEFDRGCTIRSRVDAFEQTGTSSEYWESHEDDYPYIVLPNGDLLDEIRREEWLTDPKAGWVA